MANKRKVYEESMRLGTNFVWDKDWPNAVKAYRAALQEFPTDVEALLGLATAYFELEQYESVVRALQRALKADPSNQDALLKMGQVLERLGKLTDAAKTYVYAGNILAKGGNLDAAIEHWERAIRADPDQMQARNNLAHAHARQGKMAQAVSELVALAAICQSRDDLQKAAQFLQNAARMAPDDRFVQAAAQALEAGRSIRQVQQDMAASIEAPPPSASLPSEGDEALLSFADMEELAGEADQNLPNSPREEAEQLALEELANVLFEDASGYQGLSASKSEIDKLIGQAIDWQTRGDTAQAIQTFEKITQTGFKRAAVYFMLATQYFKAGQYERAIQFYTQAKTEKPYLLGINYALGECYRSQQDANQALKHFVEALRIIDLKHARTEGTQELIRLYEELVNNYITAGDEKKTQAFVNSLANFLSTKNYEAKIIQARRRLGNGDGASVSAWVEFLEAPNSEVILTVMADTAEYMRQNMLLTASEACYKAIQKAPAYLPLHLRLAEIYMKQEAIETSIKKYLAVAEVYSVRGNLTQVTKIYQKVLKVAPMDVSVRSKLIELYIAQNQIDAALEQYEILADAYYQLAQIERSLEKHQEALRLAPKSTTPKTWQVKILHRIGDIHTQLVDWAKAAAVYEQLVTLAPDDNKAALNLIDMHFKLGRRDKALAALDRAITREAQQGRQAQMVEFLQDMTQLRPQEMELHERLAQLYVDLNMNEQAIAQFDLLGELQLDAGLHDDAARTIQKIIDLGPDDPAGYKQLLAQIKGSL